MAKMNKERPRGSLRPRVDTGTLATSECEILPTLVVRTGNTGKPLCVRQTWARKSRAKIYSMLNATVDQRNIDGDTALYIECRRGHVGVINLLMAHGASLNVCNKDGVTCLQAAAEAGNSDVVFAMRK
ncbi:ankyrin repeat and SOCS box protein 2-like [Stylophora pistillata]|uniref:ankyrin repeat and SOCS box protein 2-like n=1 Tax=Stylophora pistillata TaxID=50429 RepID=UPI000C04ABB5|nr:ankyrin repeat and SOCS box protein 2-like [Stylophora pistillata]